MADSQTVSRDLLGPVFERFLARLWLVELFHADKPGAVLFMSRGGLRLRWFYEQYLERIGAQRCTPHADFYLSRMAVFRALLLEQPAVAIPRVAAEYGDRSLLAGVESFFPPAVYAAWLAAQDNESISRFAAANFSGTALHDLIFLPRSTGAEVLRDHLGEQSRLFRKHFLACAAGKTEVVLVDTGWSGSIIQGLRAMFPDIEFKAVMVGRFNYGEPYPEWFDDIIGLEAEARHYSPLDPVTALFHHRHVIEGICEPAWPSVEYYVEKEGVVIPAQGVIPENLRAVGDDELLARGVHDYIQRDSADHSITAIELAAEKAAKRLRRMVCYPSPAEARLFSFSFRSADFGKDMDIPMFVERGSGGSVVQRVRDSLWLQGQAALEFGCFRHIPQWFISHRYFLYRLVTKFRQLGRTMWARVRPEK